jgi:dTDP-4-amino-4,6-dideoxygalactose transaminase
MSEAQAAIALLSLEDFEVNRKNNQKLFCIYDEMLSSIPGIKLLKPAGVTLSNYQYVVCEIDEENFGMSRDSLIEVLKAENVMARRYFYPGIHNSAEYRKSLPDYADSFPITDYLCGACIQLPIGAMVDSNAVGAICDLIDKSHRNADYLQPFLAESKR